MISFSRLLSAAAPELILTLAGLVVIAVDLIALRDSSNRTRQQLCAMVSSLGCGAAIAWLLVFAADFNVANGMLVLDPITRLAKVSILVFSIFTILLCLDADFTTHIGEYHALTLFATVGMTLLVSSEDFLMIFVSLELTSICLYVLTGFNHGSSRSAEAALKYFLFGSVAAAFTLFGLSLLYGFCGSTSLAGLSQAICERALQAVGTKAAGRLDSLLLLGLVMVLVGFGFKIAAAPFYLWAPDVYDAAPIPSAALIGAGSKVAGFMVLAKFLRIGFEGAQGSDNLTPLGPGWLTVIALMAAASMVVGNFAAIVQSNFRRLLAYSAVAHAGYMLLAIMAPGPDAFSSLLYYVITYGCATVGAFAVASVIEAQTGTQNLSGLEGLARRSPVLALCLAVFVLSLAGIPPLAGFFGKFIVFTSALGFRSADFKLLWLVLLALGTTVVSFYYYLAVLKRVYVVSAAPVGNTIPVSITHLIILVLAVVVVAVGCAPGLLLVPLQRALALTGF